MAHFIEARVELFVSRGAAEHVSTHGHTLQSREAQAEPRRQVTTSVATRVRTIKDKTTCLKDKFYV